MSFVFFQSFVPPSPLLFSTLSKTNLKEYWHEQMLNHDRSVGKTATAPPTVTVSVSVRRISTLMLTGNITCVEFSTSIVLKVLEIFCKAEVQQTFLINIYCTDIKYKNRSFAS